MKTESRYKNKLTTESCFHLHKILDSVESDLKLAFGLSDSALKMIAMISMVIDHIALSDRGWSYYMKRCAI